MAPKSKGAKQSKAPAPKEIPAPPAPVKEYATIAEKRTAEYLASIPYRVLFDTKGFSGLSATEKQGYAYYRLLEGRAYENFTPAQREEFWKTCEKLNVPVPLPEPGDLGRDSKGRELGTYSLREWREYQEREGRRERLSAESWAFKAKARGDFGSEEVVGEEEIEEERVKRRQIGALRGKAMGRYEVDPTWDDVVPIPQDDGEGALAQIAYTDEYAEAMSYLRACISTREHSPRVLDLTSHIITLNAAHYTVWLYRASTLFALASPIPAELDWLNTIALSNQKNYQIWHHRQLLLEHHHPLIASSPTALAALAASEIDFLTQMFDDDAKNYHVWSYRQYLVRKLNLFTPDELHSIELLLRQDVRNNSAWSHRFFLVFSDPAHSTPGCKATERDAAVPQAVVDREIQFAKAATFEAPQNQSPWNYLRGVLRKGGRKLEELAVFAGEFVRFSGDGNERGEGEAEEDVRSSHALDFLADAWVEMGQWERADRALVLLGDKYDPIRKNYWDWRRRLLKEQRGVVGGVEGLSLGEE